MKISLAITIVGVALAIALMVYRTLTGRYSAAVDVSLVMVCIVAPIFRYGLLKKELKYTKLKITDAGVTLIKPTRSMLHLDFADIKAVDKYKQGLVLVPKSKSNKVVMITNKFEDFSEIEAKIDEAIAN